MVNNCHDGMSNGNCSPSLSFGRRNTPTWHQQVGVVTSQEVGGSVVMEQKRQWKIHKFPIAVFVKVNYLMIIIILVLRKYLEMDLINIRITI